LHPFPAPGIASDPYAPGHAWVDFMTTEIDRRWRLIDKLDEVSDIAIKQQDFEEVKRLISTRLRLIVCNMQAIELNEPGFMEYVLSQEETYSYWADFGITDPKVVRAIHRGEIDPWSRGDDQ